MHDATFERGDGEQQDTNKQASSRSYDESVLEAKHSFYDFSQWLLYYRIVDRKTKHT